MLPNVTAAARLCALRSALALTAPLSEQATHRPLLFNLFIYLTSFLVCFLLQAQIISAVLIHRKRPSFDERSPALYVNLAEACWAQDPKDRPTAADTEKRLAKMITDL